MVVRRNKKDEFSHIECNQCGTPAPDGTEILKGGGLNNMGWHCVGGSHLCPEHAPEKSS